jgi:hypothetical protein
MSRFFKSLYQPPEQPPEERIERWNSFQALEDDRKMDRERREWASKRVQEAQIWSPAQVRSYIDELNHDARRLRRQHDYAFNNQDQKERRLMEAEEGIQRLTVNEETKKILEKLHLKEAILDSFKYYETSTWFQKLMAYDLLFKNPRKDYITKFFERQTLIEELEYEAYNISYHKNYPPPILQDFVLNPRTETDVLILAIKILQYSDDYKRYRKEGL